MLAPYAVRAEDSAGRKYPEPPHPYRNDFQRDRDRVIHTRAFRRLEDKTQVFTRRYSDHFRNRLTHTIEVAQISRTIAGALQLNEELVETLALVHDIGHPPFGHAGENALDAAMRQHGHFFDHNLHALHIVEQFELRYVAFPGLNLTFEVREGIIKHSRDYSADKFPALAEYRLDERPPLEAQIIDLTDEIAYITADLDDGFESRLLTLPQIRKGLPIFDRLYRQAHEAYPSAPEKLLFNEALKRFLNLLVTDLIEGLRRAIAEHAIEDVAAVRRHPHRLAAFSPEMDAQRAAAKEFLYQNLYYSAALAPEKKRAGEIVTRLFEFWIRKPAKLPHSYQQKLEHEPLPRVVCDYIAGMTDSYIMEHYQLHCAGRKRV